MECSCTEDCPPLSWDGRDDGQQAWGAERSTALTRSTRIETAISRGGDKGVLSVAESFTLEQVLSLEAASIGGGVSLQSLLLLKRLVDAGSSPTQRLKNKC